MDISDGVTLRGILRDYCTGNVDSLVSGIVQDLNAQLVLGIIKFTDGIDQAVDHELFIEDRQLDQHGRQLVFGEMSWRFLAIIFPVLKILVDEHVSMNAVIRQNDHDDEIRDQQAEVESVQLVKTFESFVKDVRLHPLVQTVALSKSKQEKSECAEQRYTLKKQATAGAVRGNLIVPYECGIKFTNFRCRSRSVIHSAPLSRLRFNLTSYFPLEAAFTTTLF